jgi:hypothetical protein
MKRLLQLLLLLILSFNLQAQQQVSYAVQAHQDDWQLFMGIKVAGDLSSGGKVVFITTTAGDGGNGSGGYLSPVPYYIARERGAIYSSKYVSDLMGGTISDTPSLTRVTINGHSIVKYSYNGNSVVNYFLRLPDGNSNGAGYTLTSFKSLKKLFIGAIPNISSVDGITTYTSWTDLITTIKMIMMAEKGTDNQVWVHTASLDSTSTTPALNNSNDHSDHYYTSKAVQDAIKDSLWVGINEFIDYRTTSLTANLSLSDHQTATALYTAYLWAMLESKYDGQFDASYKAWLPLDYFSVKRSPVGNALGRMTIGGLTEIPMIVSISDPALINTDIKMMISPYEQGKLITTVTDIGGKIIYETTTDIANRSFLTITLDKPFKISGTYVIKNVLNGKYIESRKIIVQ